MIVATAGHVDHGKTALVRALTGVDTDRLPEEKRRGMTIDLGFAYLPLAGGEPVAFIDVPGHERFVRNMTAGICGIDLALLVVAADDGPMPQTREHLEILERLGAPRLVAVLTKIDRVSLLRTGEAYDETRALLAGGRFGNAEILPVSSVSGLGLETLRARLVAHAGRVPPRQSARRFRLHVDRAFVLDGQGLVVTGTVLSGAVGLGDEVQLLPAERRTRVRSLRANHGEAQRAIAGQRCALGLQGLARGDAERGDIVVDLGEAPRSKYLDIALEPFAGARIRAGMVSVHLGTAMLPARLAPFGRFARLSFPADVSAWHGDRLLLRDPGTQRLIAGGSVADPMPPQRGAARPERVALLEALAGRDAEFAFDALLGLGAVDLDWFARAFHLPPAELQRMEKARPLVAFARHAMLASTWKMQCDSLERTVADWHAAQPASVGPRPRDLKGTLPAVIARLVEERRLAREGPWLHLPGHRPVLSAQDEALWQRAAPLLEEAPEGKPPRVHELATLLGMEPKAVADFLQRAARAGRVYRVAPNRFLLPKKVNGLVELAIALDEESAGQGFPAALYRDRSGLGRNLTIQVLEFLDEAGYTKRAGELRRARKPITEEQRPRWGARTSNPERGA